MRRRRYWLLFAGLLAGCNPDGACVSKELDVCSHTTEHGCASTMGGAEPGEFHANKECKDIGYSYPFGGSFKKPPVE